MVIDKKMVKHKEYRLVRHHLLDTDGSLTVVYYTTDKNGNAEYLAEWEEYKDNNVKYLNANNIGVAYFKSPQDSRGLYPDKGVPLNFGCEEEEAKIRKARKDLDEEMELMKAKLFADKSITRVEKTTEGDRHSIPEGVFLIQKKAGVDGTLIDSFAPSTRYADYKQRLDDALAEWEDAVGLDRGFLTEAEHTGGATATEIRTANTKTRSFVKKIQAALADGIKATITADGVFLNIAPDLYTLTIDWFDPFLDEEAQYNRIANAVDRGVLEKKDELKWLYPDMSDEEIEEKLARLSASAQVDTDLALERIISGG
jgi:hypothetical protein